MAEIQLIINLMKKRITRTFAGVLTVLAALWAPVSAQVQLQLPNDEAAQAAAPRWALKTNLLYDATATINLGVEYRVGDRTTLELSGNYNPWTFGEGKQWKHWMVQPEFRMWMREAFAGHFFGLHAHYADYELNRLPKPFSPYMREHGFDGTAVGAGLSYGYRWNLGRRIALEATIGVGYAYLDYDEYGWGSDAPLVGTTTTMEEDLLRPVAKHYFGPTKAGLNLIFNLGRGERAPRMRPVYASAAGEPNAAPVLTVVIPQLPASPRVRFYGPQLTASFVVPETETIKARSDSGKAYLDFPKGSTQILPAFRNNGAELQKIHEITTALLRDPDVTIMGISINGYASPEGEYARNMELSERRAAALRDHVATVQNLSTDLFSAQGEGEDWALLDSLVEHSRMPDKFRVLEIIRSTEYFDVRYRKLLALSGGKPYRQMEADFFPQLRRSNYRINYTVAPLSGERAREVLKTRPGNLSLHELFVLAEVHTPGSDAFNEIFQIAAREFPDSDVANINAAASALGRLDEAAAVNYLNRVNTATAAYWNNAGLLYWMQGKKELAAQAFARGGVQGAANAEELRKHAQSILQNR